MTPATILLLLPAVLLAIAGVLLLSQATTGVGVLCLALFFAVCARIAQAGAHHKALLQQLQR